MEKQFINKSGFKFLDISAEMYRCYVYPGGSKIVVYRPLYLYGHEDGSQFVFDFEGVSHHVMAGYIHTYWKAFDGMPNFQERDAE